MRDHVFLFSARHSEIIRLSLSAMRFFSKNFRLLWARDALNTAAVALTSTTVLLPLYLRLSMSDGQIGALTSFTQAENVVLSLLLSGITGRYSKTKRIVSWMYAIQSAVTIGYLTLCLIHGIGAAPAAVIVFALATAVNAIISVRVIFDYKLLCEVIDVADYSFYASVGGIINGAFSIAAGLILPLMYSLFDFYSVTSAAVLCSSLFLVLAWAANSRLDLLPGSEKDIPQSERKSLLKTAVSGISDVFRDGDFRRMIIPNFTRGLGAGILSMIPLLAVRCEAVAEENTSLIVGITNASVFLSCAVYAALRKVHMKASVLNFAGSLLFILIIPSLTGGFAAFAVFYFIAYAGYNVVSYAIPDIVYNTVSEDIISAYNTWRMAFTTFGIVISTAVIGAVMSLTSGMVIAAVSAVLMLITCAAYLKNYRKRV